MKKTISLLLSVLMVLSVFMSIPVTDLGVTANAASGKFTYEKIGKEYMITGYSGGGSGELVIPATYKGLPVTSIGAFSDFGKNNFTSIVISNGIKEIGDYAFNNCKKVKSISIPKSVNNIYESAFVRLESLENITINTNNKKYCVKNNVLFSKNMKKLMQYPVGSDAEFYKIPDGVTYVASNAFSAANDLETVVCPVSLETISYAAFSDCEDLEKVVLNKGLKSIGDFAFVNCTDIKAINIPSSVEYIGDSAFGHYEDEKSIWLRKDLVVYGIKGSYASTYGFKFRELKKPVAPIMKKVVNDKAGVKLTWKTILNADVYYIYRKEKGGSYKYIGKSYTDTYTDKTAKSGKTYYYNIKANNIEGTSASSSAFSIKYLADTTLKTPVSTKNGITLKWSKVTGAQGYEVYRKTGSGSYAKIATVKGVSKVSYTDKKAQKGKTYTYSIKAYSGKTYSAFSDTKRIKDRY